MSSNTINPKLQKAIDRVIALRKLADSAKQINSLEEMDACLRRSDEILSEYRITEAMLEARGEKTPDPMVHEKILYGIGKRRVNFDVVLNALTKHYGGTYYFTNKRDAAGSNSVEYWVVARESDYQMMEFTFLYIIEEIERLADMLTDTRGKKGPGARASFCLGCAEGVASLFADIDRAAREEAEVLERLDGKKNAALVLLSNRSAEASVYLEKNLGVKLRKAVGLYGGQDRDMRREGYSAGRNINISHNPLGGSSDSRRLKG